jgi:hypothetical protein
MAFNYFYENEKYSTTLAKFSQILENLNNNVKPTVFHKFSRIIVTNCTGSAHYFMETKFVPLRKIIRNS